LRCITHRSSKEIKKTQWRGKTPLTAVIKKLGKRNIGKKEVNN